MTVLPVTVFVVLDGFGVGFGVGLAAGFVGVGEAFADADALADAELLDEVATAVLGELLGAAAVLPGAELTEPELTEPELTDAGLSGADEAGAALAGADDSPGVAPERATGRGALAEVVLNPSRTMSPATVATKTVTKRRMTQPPS